MNKSDQRLRVAVVFGGRSAEHDVSIVSGVQTLDAIDSTQYDAFPIYIAENGQWYAGDGLRDKRNYPIAKSKVDTIFPVDLSISESTVSHRGVLKKQNAGLLNRNASITFDVAFPVLHGTYGEDGTFQGLMELCGIPYTGPRVKDAVITMDKVLAKQFFMQMGLPVLPAIPVYKPTTDGFFNVADLTANLGLEFPLCAKPANLGSSIGVHKVNNQSDLNAALLDIFGMDDCAILEPFVENLIEYNVAVSQAFGDGIRLSVIERPINDKNGDGAVLDFAAKYRSGSDDPDSKLAVRLTEGMVSSTREFNPKSLSPENKALIEHTAITVFNHLGATGAPRLDFYGNKQTGQIWLNEINPMPGSYGYFLWENADTAVSFLELTTALIHEGLRLHARDRALKHGADAGKAKLFG